MTVLNAVAQCHDDHVVIVRFGQLANLSPQPNVFGPEMTEGCLVALDVDVNGSPTLAAVADAGIWLPGMRPDTFAATTGTFDGYRLAHALTTSERADC